MIASIMLCGGIFEVSDTKRHCNHGNDCVNYSTSVGSLSCQKPVNEQPFPGPQEGSQKTGVRSTWSPRGHEQPVAQNAYRLRALITR